MFNLPVCAVFSLLSVVRGGKNCGAREGGCDLPQRLRGRPQTSASAYRGFIINPVRNSYKFIGCLTMVVRTFLGIHIMFNGDGHNPYGFVGFCAELRMSRIKNAPN